MRHYASWREAPSDTLRAELRQLRSRARLCCFTHATPRLHQVLAAL